MDNPVKEKLITIGKAVLTNARNELYLSMRFLDMALSSLEYQMHASVFFVGTDGNSLFFHPRFLAERYQYDSVLVNRAYLHMILHCIFGHVFEDIPEENVDLWNLACDIATEYIIDDMEYPSVCKPVSDNRREVYGLFEERLHVLTAQGIYQRLLQMEQQGKLPLSLLHSWESWFLVDDHCFWFQKRKEEETNTENENGIDQERKPRDENDREKSKSKDTAEKRKNSWQKVSRMMQTNLETFSDKDAKKAVLLAEGLQVSHREKIDFESFLRKFSMQREEMRVDIDSFDYVFYCYGLDTYGNLPLIESLEYKEQHKIEEFVIVIDTSGSCTGSLIKHFLQKTYEILSDEIFGKERLNIHIIQCDERVQEDVVIEKQEQWKEFIENFQVKGYGNTDFRPAFTYVQELINQKAFHNLKGLLYFTDGYGTFPKQRPAYDVAFVFLENHYTDKEVPPWAMKVILQEEEMQKERLQEDVL